MSDQKNSRLKVVWYAAAALTIVVLLTAIYLVNVGQELAVRLGSLGEAPHLVSAALLNEMAALKRGGDIGAAMRGFYAVLNALLWLLLALFAIAASAIVYAMKAVRHEVPAAAPAPAR